MMYFDKDGNLVFDEPIEDENGDSSDEKTFKYDLFRDILKNILEEHDQLPWEIVKKTYSAFVINRSLANNNKFLNLALLMNRYSSAITPELHYNLLNKAIQPKKKTFLGYFKESKATKNIRTMARFFNVSENEMQELTSFISEKEIKNILKKIENFGSDKVSKK